MVILPACFTGVTSDGSQQGKSTLKSIAVFLITLALAACGGGSSSTDGGTETGDTTDVNSAESVLTSCQNPRPVACTLDIQPVCAVLDNGQLDTYDNACTACADEAVAGHYPGACAQPAMTACQDPRPQACTADYRPVCGQLTNGETKTYGNACSACGDAAVIGSFPGECP